MVSQFTRPLFHFSMIRSIWSPVDQELLVLARRGNRRRNRPCLANFAIQQAIVKNLIALIALLEKMGDSGVTTLVVDIADPIKIHGATFFYSGLFTASDDPLDTAIEVMPKIDRAE